MQPTRVKTISEFLQMRDLPRPAHPLISVINLTRLPPPDTDISATMVFDFYTISLKRHFHAKMTYGQQPFDFDEGVMSFMSPGQVFSIEFKKEEVVQQSGWMLCIHPDFLWNTPLAKKIKQYEFFDYSVNEALFLSEKEEATMNSILQIIEQEYDTNIDKFSQDLIISQLETLLTYSERFYQRQFITRKINNHRILTRLEALLDDYFSSEALAEKGLPTVKYISGELHVSPNYLSGLLKTLTGKSTQQHIHDKVIEKAKEMLAGTGMSVSEIAYELGFEYPQSFSKLFKLQTNLSPQAFRQGFN